MMFNNLIEIDKFFGRDKELELLHKRVEGLKNGYRHNLAILGKRQIGKTSLLLHFLSGIDKKGTIPIYADLSSLTFESFVDQFVGMMLYYGCANTPADDASLQQLIDAAAAELPKTSKKIKSLYSYVKSGKETAAFQELCELAPCYSEESGKFCLIAIDNFKKLSDFNIKEPFSILGEKIMLQKKCFYILCDYPDAESMKILSEKLSLLFGKFQVINLEPFSLSDSLAFINLKCPGVALPPCFDRFLVDFTAGEPFYLDILSDAVSRASQESSVPAFSEQQSCYLVAEAIYGKFSPLNSYFSQIIAQALGVSGMKPAIKLLKAILYNNKISAILENSCIQRQDAQKILEKLVLHNIVIKNGPLYAIEDEVFKIWIKLKDAQASPRFNITSRLIVDKIETALQQEYQDFIKEMDKPVDNKILNLINAFDNEKVTVGEKTHILPVFKHIRSDYIDSESLLLSAHGTKMWMFSVLKKSADENDVLNFIKHCKSQKHKISRKILIALGGITSEAKLVAKQEGMWIWTENKLNALMNLYGKPKVSMP